ncbi:DUF748 domain-containing protein [Halodesulfovibrio sp.]|jgi:uncharacterized protein involved in outer membrane biogenesis|uniref:DUF748 domain-containing protein n=1 Tax=Halodesulfovibrio sp. TaxID=1912772 RepID=UPI0025D15AD2|nr:DUF748 domain-containing protein [Halodesulfovibrio sp.]MCT4534830.1 DUF748 domain-containing protein [Halodesulfovibrio sp.]
MHWKSFFATPLRKITSISILTLISLCLLYITIGFLVIAPVAKWQLEKQLPPLLHRKVSVGEITLNPLTLRVQFKNVIISKKEAAGNLFSIEMLEAQLAGESIYKLAPVVDHIRIVKPYINITRYKDDHLSIDDIITEEEEASEKKKEQPVDEQDARIFPFKVLNVMLEDGTIKFNDEKMDAVQTISNLSLSIPLASSFPIDLNKPVKPQLSMQINDTPIKVDGEAYLFSNNYLTKFSFTTDNISLARYWRYVPIPSPVALTSGALKLAINLGFSRPEDKPIDLHLDGVVELTDLGITKTDKEPVLTIPNISLALEDFSLAEKKLILKSIEIDSPFVEVVREKNNAINWATYFTPEKKESTASNETPAKNASTQKINTKSVAEALSPSKEPSGQSPKAEARTAKSTPPSSEPPQEKEKPFTVMVQSFAIKKGKITFKDNAVPNTFKTTLEPVDVSIQGFSTTSTDPAKVNISIGQKKMLSVEGVVSLSPFSADLKTAVNSLAVPQFMPYIAAAIPANISSGTITAGAALKISTAQPSRTDITITNGSVNLQKLVVTGKNFQKPPIVLGGLTVDGATIDVPNKSISCGKINLSAPDITVTRTKDGIDLTSLFSADSKKGESEKNTSSQKKADTSWKLLIQTIGIQNGTITFNDTAVKKSVVTKLKDLSITASDLTLAHKPSKFAVSTGVNGNSSIKADGTFAHSPLILDTKIDIKNLNIPDFAGYIEEYSAINVSKGAISATAQTKVSVPDSGTAAYSVAGNVTVDNIAAANKDTKQAIGSVGQLAVTNFAFDSAKNSAEIGSVSITSPSTSFTKERDGSLSIVRAVERNPSRTQRGQNSQAAVKAATSPFGLTIGAIAIKNGSVKFEDASISPHVVFDIRDISASYKKFNLHRANTSPINFSATLQGQRITISGAVNPMAKPFALDITAKLEDIGLQKFSPYTVKYIAYPIKTGALDAHIQLKIQQNKLNAQNKLVFQDMTLGKRNPNSKAPAAPIKLGLSLMRQPNGNIPINLPVTGNLNDPNFHINQIITSTLINVIVKAATSPFAVLGSVIGEITPEEAKYVKFKPGYAAVTKSEADVLNKIGSVLAKKTSLKLECIGYYSADADTNGLKDRAVELAVIKKWYDSLSRGTRKNIDLNTAKVPKYNYEKYLEQAYEDAPSRGVDKRPSGLFGYDDQTRKQMEEYLRSTADTSPEALKKLAEDRANAVRETILKRYPTLKDRVKAVVGGSAKKGVPKSAVELKISQ